MPSKELIEKVARAMCEQDGANWNAKDCFQTTSGDEPEQQREYWLDKAQAAISTILAALQEPTEGMLAVPYKYRDLRSIIRDVLATSALGEQSE